MQQIQLVYIPAADLGFTKGEGGLTKGTDLSCESVRNTDNSQHTKHAGIDPPPSPPPQEIWKIGVKYYNLEIATNAYNMSI